MRVLGLYPDKTSASAAHFFEERVLKEMPFPIERVQSDRGGEFIGTEFMSTLRKHKVKLRPIRPRSPHPAADGGRHGKVERSQQTDLMEFYALEIDGKGRQRKAREPEGMADRLAEWQRFYNEVRPHGGIGSKAPIQRLAEVAELTPTRAEMDARYDPSKEPTTIRRGKWRWVPTAK